LGAPRSPFADLLQARADAEGKAQLFFSKTLGTRDSDSDDSDSGEEETADNTHVVWLPAEYKRVEERVRRHCLYGEGETERLKARISLGSTDAGNLKAEIFEAELESVKRLRGLPSKLCALLALTKTMCTDTYWMHDNEVPEEIAGLMADVAKYWRTVVLTAKNGDGALGLGLTDDPAERARSREALGHLLRFYKKRVEEACHCPVKFNCVPGPSRKRRGCASDGGTPAKVARPAGRGAAASGVAK